MTHALDLHAMRHLNERIARIAGAVVLGHYERPHTETEKSSIRDVVTEGDKASEEIILSEIRRHTPGFGVLSEESGEIDLEGAPYYWVIDPIDGTTNFASNLPFFSISIALADAATRRPLTGVVYNPVYNELFSAAAGQGATLNGRPIHVSRTSALERAVLCSGFTYDRSTHEIENMGPWTAMMAECRDLRRFGSAALDLSFVACGRLDGFWEKHVHAWDVMAGLLLVTEAGGTVSDYAGVPGDVVYSGAEVVASNGLLHESMRAVLNRA
jgi:myo-inositol-1(or 4)-monophosphatase